MSIPHSKPFPAYPGLQTQMPVSLSDPLTSHSTGSTKNIYMSCQSIETRIQTISRVHNFEGLFKSYLTIKKSWFYLHRGEPTKFGLN